MSCSFVTHGDDMISVVGSGTPTRRHLSTSATTSVPPGRPLSHVSPSDLVDSVRHSTPRDPTHGPERLGYRSLDPNLLRLARSVRP